MSTETQQSPDDFPEVCPVHGTPLLHYYGTVACGACLEPSQEES